MRSLLERRQGVTEQCLQEQGIRAQFGGVHHAALLPALVEFEAQAKQREGSPPLASQQVLLEESCPTGRSGCTVGRRAGTSSSMCAARQQPAMRYN